MGAYKPTREEKSAGMTIQIKREYELVYIIQTELNEDEINDVNERVTQMITSNDGEIVSTEIWGQRKLAYPIKNHFEGYYVLHNIQMPPSSTTDVERLLRLNEDILRYLLVRADE